MAAMLARVVPRCDLCCPRASSGTSDRGAPSTGNAAQLAQRKLNSITCSGEDCGAFSSMRVDGASSSAVQPASGRQAAASAINISPESKKMNSDAQFQKRSVYMQLVEGQELYLRVVSAAGKAEVDIFRPDPHDASVSKREWTRQCSRWRKAMRCILGVQIPPPVPNHTEWEDCGASFSMRVDDVSSSAVQLASSGQVATSAINISDAQLQKRIGYVQ